MERYKPFVPPYSNSAKFEEDPDGEWVKWEDACRYKKMLKELEFIQVEFSNSIEEYCPICNGYYHTGHTKDCRLQALLREGNK